MGVGDGGTVAVGDGTSVGNGVEVGGTEVGVGSGTLVAVAIGWVGGILTVVGVAVAKLGTGVEVGRIGVGFGSWELPLQPVSGAKITTPMTSPKPSVSLVLLERE